MKKITVMGLGYIGLPTAITLSCAGFNVCGFDVSENVVNTLKGGKLHIVEPDLQEALDTAMQSGNLNFSSQLEKADVYYIAVPTPFYTDENGAKHADLSYVESAGRMAGKILEQGNLVILESTVPPRTSEMLERVLCEESKLTADKFHVAHCPERVIPGKMLYELRNNDRIIGGRDEKACQMAKEIYETVLETGICRVTDDITAEMCKLTENTFRDVNIAYANELSVICDKMGIDVFELISLANCHPRVNILTPGVGVGGHCIAVDPWFIYEQFPEEAQVILASRKRNEQKPRFVAERVIEMIKGDKNAKIAVLGLSYKPDVDDLRESPSIELCNILMDKGYTVLAVEPFAQEGIVDGIQNVSLETALNECAVSVITLAHTVFREKLDEITKKPVYDCVGCID